MELGNGIYALDALEHTWWAVLGRNDYSDGQTHAWPGNPDPENVTAVDPDLDQSPDSPTIFKSSLVSLIVTSDVGNIYFGGQRWILTDSDTAQNVYFKFVLDTSMVPNMIGYRRTSLRADLVPYDDTTTYGVKSQFSNYGSLFFYANHELKTRLSNEVIVVEIVLPYGVS